MEPNFFNNSAGFGQFPSPGGMPGAFPGAFGAPQPQAKPENIWAKEFREEMALVLHPEKRVAQVGFNGAIIPNAMQNPAMAMGKPRTSSKGGKEMSFSTMLLIGAAATAFLFWAYPVISALPEGKIFDILPIIGVAHSYLSSVLGVASFVIPFVFVLVFLADKSKFHPFILWPLISVSSFVVHHAFVSGVLPIPLLSELVTKLIVFGTYALSGFGVVMFLAMIAFYRTKYMQEQKNNNPLLGNSPFGASAQPFGASPFGQSPFGSPAIGGQSPQPEEKGMKYLLKKMFVLEDAGKNIILKKFGKLSVYVILSVVFSTIMYKTMPVEAMFGAMFASGVLFGGSLYGMALYYYFFFNPKAWKAKIEVAPEPEIMPQIWDAPEQSWQEELRDNIQNKLQSQKIIGVALGDFTESPTTIAYELQLPDDLSVARLNTALANISTVLGGKKFLLDIVDGQQYLTVTKDADKCFKLFIHDNPKFPDTRGLMEEAQDVDFQKFNDPQYLILGKNMQSKVVFTRLEDLPHLLVVGGSGSGKSKGFHAVLYGLLSRNTPETLQLCLGDPKSELARYKDLGFMREPICSEAEQVEGMLQRANEEGNRRIHIFRDSVKGETFDNIDNYNKYCKSKGLPILPRIVVVLDELADFTEVMTQSSDKRNQQIGENINNTLTMIAKKHRAQGVHLFLATQRADGRVVPIGARAQCSVLSVWQLEAGGNIAFGLTSTSGETAGTSNLVPKTGDALFKQGANKAIRIQLPYIDEKDLNAKIEEWKQSPMIGEARFASEEDKTWQEVFADTITKKLRSQSVEGVELGEYNEAQMTISYKLKIPDSLKIDSLRKAFDNLEAQNLKLSLVMRDGSSFVEAVKEKEYQKKLFMKDFIEKAKEQSPEKYASSRYLLMGEDTLGKVVYAELEALPHLLVTGGTGSGKSKTFHAIIHGILSRTTPRDTLIALGDPKSELARYRDLGFVWNPICSSGEEVAAMLDRAYQEGERRISLFRALGIDNIDNYNKKMAQEGKEELHLPRILVILDELADFTAVLMQENKTLGKSVVDSLTKIAKKHRAQGIHLFLATQRADTGVVASGIRSQCSVVSAYQKEIDAKLAFGTDDDPGTSKLVSKSGDALFKLGERDPIRTQFPYINEDELNADIEAWKNDPRIGKAPDFDVLIESGRGSYATSLNDLEPPAMDFKPVFDVLPESVGKRDNVFVHNEVRKLVSYLVKEKKWDVTTISRTYGSIKKATILQFEQRLIDARILVPTNVNLWLKKNMPLEEILQGIEEESIDPGKGLVLRGDMCFPDANVRLQAIIVMLHNFYNGDNVPMPTAETVIEVHETKKPQQQISAIIEKEEEENEQDADLDDEEDESETDEGDDASDENDEDQDEEIEEKTPQVEPVDVGPIEIAQPKIIMQSPIAKPAQAQPVPHVPTPVPASRVAEHPVVQPNQSVSTPIHAPAVPVPQPAQPASQVKQDAPTVTSAPQPQKTEVKMHDAFAAALRKS